MAKDHSDTQWKLLLFLISSKGYFIYTIPQKGKYHDLCCTSRGALAGTQKVDLLKHLQRALARTQNVDLLKHLQRTTNNIESTFMTNRVVSMASVIPVLACDWRASGSPPLTLWYFTSSVQLSISSVLVSRSLR